MLDLSPQIFEVMGASRRLTRFTSTCLCLLLLSLAQHLVRKSFFFFSRHHSQFPLCLDSLPLDDCPRAAPCLAQDTRRRALSQPVSVPPQGGPVGALMSGPAGCATGGWRWSHVKRLTFHGPGRLNPSPE